MIKNSLSRLISVGRSWLFVLWIYVSVGWRFWPWRLRLWLKQPDTVESIHTGMKQTLLFIRHGQTTWNVEHRLPGQLPGVTLNDTGRKQAARLADALHILPISAIISSPLERARDTAEIIAQGRGLNMQFEPDLMDINVGHWAGKVYDDLTKNDPAWKAFVRDPGVAPEGVETFPQVQQRAMAAVERWRKQKASDAYIAFVAHADVIKLLIAHYTGLEAVHAGSLFIDNASVSLVELDGDQRPRVVGIGWSPHPGWLKPPATEPAKSETTHPNGEQKT
jgi:broad specificity phosphatase PhoE